MTPHYCPHCHRSLALVAKQTRRCTSTGCGKNIDTAPAPPVKEVRTNCTIGNQYRTWDAAGLWTIH